MGPLRKKGMALILCFILSAQFSWAGSSGFDDHWAYETMVKLAQAQVFSPVAKGWSLDDPISRGGFLRLINRAWGNSAPGGSSFNDLHQDNLYFKDISSAVARGYVSGYPDGSFKPAATITRQEAAAIISKAIKMEGTKLDLVLGFEDKDDVPEWTRGYMSNMILKGYIKGYPDQSIRAQDQITYGEALALIDNVMGYICKSNDINDTLKVYKGNVSVIQADVRLENIKIEGNLIIGGQVEDGDVTLSSVEVTGDLLVFGGGRESIHIENSKIGKLIVERHKGPVRIYAKEGALIERTVVETSAILQEAPATEGFLNVEIMPSTKGMHLDLNGSFNQIHILEGQGQNLLPPSEINGDGTNVNETTEFSSGVTVNIKKGSKVSDLKVENRSKILGEGTVKSAQVDHEYVSLEVNVDKVTVSSDVEGVEIFGKKVTKEKSFSTETIRQSRQSESTSKKSSKNDKEDKKDQDTHQEEKTYTLVVEPIFMGAPLLNISVKNEGVLLRNCTLYMESKVYAQDKDGDGILSIPASLFNEDKISIGYVDHEIHTFEILK